VPQARSRPGRAFGAARTRDAKRPAETGTGCGIKSCTKSGPETGTDSGTGEFRNPRGGLSGQVSAALAGSRALAALTPERLSCRPIKFFKMVNIDQRV
jgi:hypothetical protein